jgi:hypothetical protein
VKESFDSVIKDKTMFEYRTKPNPDGLHKEGGGLKVNEGVVEIWVFEGLDGSLVHETRHGAGYLNDEFGWDHGKGEPTYYDYQDEYEGFKQMSDYNIIIWGNGGRSDKAIKEHIESLYSSYSFIIKKFEQVKVPKQ